jgi:hypothetical protein
MKRALIASTILSLVFALPTLAIESNAPPPVQSKKPVPTFDQRKAQVLKRLDERSTRLQEEKVCVQAAQNDEDLLACRQKSGPPDGQHLKGRQGSLGPPGITAPAPPPNQ